MKDSTMEVGRENNRIATVEMFAVARNDGIDMNGKDLFVSHNNNVKVGLRKETAFSGKQRFLVACIVLLLLALSVTIILLIIRESKDEKVKTKDICLTNDCVTVAAKVIQAANFSVDPCNNFYEYACGGWKAGKFLPDSKSELNGFIMLKDKIANIMKRTFSAKISYKPESALSKLIQFYRSCTNVTKLEDRAGHPLKDLLQVLGSWPVLNDSWSEIGWDMENSFFKNHELLFSYIHHGRPAPFFNSYVKVDEKNSSAHIISIDQPQFKLMPKYYLKDKQAWKKVYGAYRTMMREYVALLGGNASSTQVEDMLELDIKLANATVSDDVFRDVIKTYKTMALKDFIKEVGSEFGWQEYFSMVFRGTKKVITSDTMIGSKSIEYLKKTNEILKSTSKRIIANYLGWIVVQKYGPHLSQKFRNIDFTFRRAYQGVSKDTDHWLKCFSVVEDNMDMATARVFLQTAFNQNGRDLARQVVEGVKKAFIKRLQNLDWMDAATKIKAEKKANQMIYDIAYPDYINKDTQLDNLYKDLQISQTTYFVNLVNSYKLRRKLNLELINQRVNKRQWDLPPTMVNAYYDVSNNKMGFLAGIMDYPFFNIKGPMSIRYGSFGFVAGHEITHGFDDQGRLYDSSGDLKDWWSPSSAKEFRDKADCIYKQYSTYKYYGLNINANLTMGENIADNGGLKIAYQAYKEWEQKHGKELKLPGIDLNHDQLFFLAKGQLWCGIVNEQKGKEIILQDPHSPAHLRVIGTMSNSDEFQEAFNCSANAPMVRKHKCSLW